MKHTLKGVAAIGVLGIIGAAVALWSPASAGNGAPSGSHYNLNIIGVENPKKADMTSSNRHTIFVPLNNNVSGTKIWLCESGSPACPQVPANDYQVLDGNGTDSNGARFALPDPDNGTPCEINDCTTAYSVYVRGLGQPGGSAEMTSCRTDRVDTVNTDTFECSTESAIVDAHDNDNKFTNVSRELLTLCVDLDNNGSCDRREYLFAIDGEDYWWDYFNTGLRLAQLRFYPQPSTFGAA
jgi:hypothetical protein